jgi:hypothetical protein
MRADDLRQVQNSQFSSSASVHHSWGPDFTRSYNRFMSPPPCPKAFGETKKPGALGRGYLLKFSVEKILGRYRFQSGVEVWICFSFLEFCQSAEIGSLLFLP